MMKKGFLCSWGTAFLLLLASPLLAQDGGFYCEVMGIEGSAYLSNASVQRQALKEGDVLTVNDVIEVSPDSAVDLAYDKEWNNVTRIEENSKVSVQSIYPINLDLDKGGIYAKLKSLPRESTFEVKTPTAVATARGTEYRTTYENGETQVSNFSESNVYVFGRSAEGTMQSEPVIVKNSERTHILKAGNGPSMPERMKEEDLRRGEKFRLGVDKKIQEHVARGHYGKIQDIKSVEKKYQEELWHRKEGASSEGRHPLVSREASFENKPEREKFMEKQSERLNAIRRADRRERFDPNAEKHVGQGSGNFQQKNGGSVHGPLQRPAQERQNQAPEKKDSPTHSSSKNGRAPGGPGPRR